MPSRLRASARRAVRDAALIGVLGLASAACPGFGDRTLADLTPMNMGADPPTWENAVKMILTERCAPCHQNPPQNFAPAGFRLDKYDLAESGDGIDGAFEKRERVIARAVTAGTMPPGNPLSDGEKAILLQWLMNGAPRGVAGGM